MKTVVRHSFRNDILGVYFTGVISFLAYFLLSTTVSSQLGTQEFGHFILSIKVGILISNILAMGYPLAIRIFLSHAVSMRSSSAAVEIFSWAARQLLRVVIFCGFCLLLRSTLIVNQVEGHWLFLLVMHPCALVILVVPFLVLINFIPPVLDVLHQFKLSRLTQNVIGHAAYCFLLICGCLFGVNWDVEKMIMGYFLSQMFIAVLMVGYLYHKFTWVDFRLQVMSQFSLQYSKVAVQGWLAHVSYQLVINLSVLMMGILVLDPAVLSHFSAIMVILNFYFLLSEALRGYLSQRLLEVSRASRAQGRSMLIEALFTNAVGTLIVYFVGLFAQKQILSFFGEEFLQDQQLLHVALTLNALMNILQPLWSVVEYTKPKLNAVLCLVQLVLTAVALWVLIPTYGILGALIGDILPEFIIVLYLLEIARREYGLFSVKYRECLAELAIKD